MFIALLKYIAHVTEVRRSGIHKIATVEEGEVVPIDDLPLPNRVEIKLDGGREDPCMMYRYTDPDQFCGDTWHTSLKDAFAQAEFEFGLVEADFEEFDVAE